jgi:hypothetical protein
MNNIHLQVTANVPGSLILLTLTMEAIRSSETSAVTKAYGVTCKEMTFSCIEQV